MNTVLREEIEYCISQRIVTYFYEEVQSDINIICTLPDGIVLEKYVLQHD